MKKSNKSVKPISSDIIRSKMIVDAAEKERCCHERREDHECPG